MFWSSVDEQQGEFEFEVTDLKGAKEAESVGVSSFQKKEKKKKWVSNPDDIVASVHTNDKGELYSNAVVDVFNYSMEEEANEETTFNIVEFIDDVFVRFFDPLTFLYVYFRHGYVEMQIRFMAPPPKQEFNDDDAINTKFYDPDDPPFTFPSSVFWILINLLNVIRLLIIASFFVGKIYDSDNVNRSRAPLYLFGITTLFYLLVLISMANKKALRKPSESKRLLLFKERRNEELLYGWLPLPWHVAVFELRLAAAVVGEDISSGYFTFKECNEEDE